MRSTGEALGGRKGQPERKAILESLQKGGVEWSHPSTFTFCLDVCTRSAHAQKDGQDWFAGQSELLVLTNPGAARGGGPALIG